MHRKLAHKTRRAFVLIFLLPILLSLVVYNKIDNYQRVRSWIVHTHVVLYQLSSVEISVMQIQNTLQNYLLTGNHDYVKKCSVLQQVLVNNVREIGNSTADNDVQYQSARILADKLVGFNEYVNSVLGNWSTTKHTQKNINAVVEKNWKCVQEIWDASEKMKREEQSLLQERTTTLYSHGVSVAIAFVIYMIVNLALLVWCYRTILKSGLRRDVLEEDLRYLNKTLEARVEERTRQLDYTNKQLLESNEDLTRFAHVVSHDLQEPLRTISSYVTLFSRKHAEVIDEESQLFIRYITSGVSRLQGLIKDLLIYSKVGTESLKLQLVDANLLVKEVCDSLNVLIEEHHAQVIYSNLPTIRVDGNKILQVLLNLINNAIKYRKPDVDPVIRIEGKLEGNDWLFSVNDNSAGFDQQYADRIFNVFQRLHSFSEKEGSGMGLSICKKIIELHKGKIWVTSEEGVGSTFYFTIPKRT